MTQTPNITPEMVRARGTEIAVCLRAEGVPVVGVDAPDDTESVGLVFRLPVGRLCGFRLHYDDAGPDAFRDLLICLGWTHERT